MSIIRHDKVLAITGHFKDKRGYVCRVENGAACVVWKGVWDHGIWTNLSELKRTKQYKSEQREV